LHRLGRHIRGRSQTGEIHPAADQILQPPGITAGDAHFDGDRPTEPVTQLLFQPIEDGTKLFDRLGGFVGGIDPEHQAIVRPHPGDGGEAEQQHPAEFGHANLRGKNRIPIWKA